MSKSNHFFGQPLYGQLVNLLDKEKILELSRSKGGERYIKRFDAWTHLVTMLYAVIMRHDSLREISVSMLAEARKLSHIGITMMPTLHYRMPMLDVRKLYLSLFTSGSIKDIVKSFARTAEAA